MNKSNEINHRNLTLAIQAGGLSKRMGQDKALLPFANPRLIEYIANRGKMLTNDLLIRLYDPDFRAFTNLNTVEEYQLAEELMIDEQLTSNPKN